MWRRRSQNERGLLHCEEWFRLSFEHAPAAMALITPGGRYQQVNPAMCALTGYTETQLVQLGIADITHPDDVGDDLAAVATLVAGECDSVVLEKRYLTPAGGCIWATGSATLMRRPDGSPHYVISQLTDGLAGSGELRHTTGAVTVQSAVQDSAIKFRQLADNVDAAFTLRTWEPDAVVYISPGYQTIFGYDPTTVPESPTHSLQHIHPDDRARFMSEYWNVCRAGQPARAEYRIVRPDGEIRWVRTASSPVPAGEGEPRRSTAITTDITDSRLAQAALAAVARKAETVVAAQNEFLARMSHELRTPMNAILGFAQLLELDATPGPEQDAVQHILRGGWHLVSLIDDLRDFASIESDRLELNVTPFPVAELLLATTALMSPLAAAAQVELVYHPDRDGEHWVRADARRLRQVLLNLLSNAIKYNHPNGRVEVSCELTTIDRDTTRPGRAPPGSLDIVVSDTGLGIRDENLPRLFTPFDRLGVQEHGIDGTGVGLALSLRLMSKMGGGLRATSHYGVGSRFIASLPLAEAPDPTLGSCSR